MHAIVDAALPELMGCTKEEDAGTDVEFIIAVLKSVFEVCRQLFTTIAVAPSGLYGSVQRKGGGGMQAEGRGGGRVKKDESKVIVPVDHSCAANASLLCLLAGVSAWISRHLRCSSPLPCFPLCEVCGG